MRRLSWHTPGLLGGYESSGELASTTRESQYALCCETARSVKKSECAQASSVLAQTLGGCYALCWLPRAVIVSQQAHYWPVQSTLWPCLLVGKDITAQTTVEFQWCNAVGHHPTFVIPTNKQNKHKWIFPSLATTLVWYLFSFTNRRMCILKGLAMH